MRSLRHLLTTGPALLLCAWIGVLILLSFSCRATHHGTGSPERGLQCPCSPCHGDRHYLGWTPDLDTRRYSPIAAVPNRRTVHPNWPRLRSANKGGGRYPIPARLPSLYPHHDDPQFFAAVAIFCLTNRKPNNILPLTLTAGGANVTYQQFNLFGGVDPVTPPGQVPSELITDVLMDILPPNIVEGIANGSIVLIAVDITPAPPSNPFKPAKAEWAQGQGFVAEPTDEPEDSKPSEE